MHLSARPDYPTIHDRRSDGDLPLSDAWARLPGRSCCDAVAGVNVDSMRPQPVPPELTDGWQTTLVQWTKLAHHDHVLGVAAKHKQLPWLAARYRDAARSNPSDPIAKERLVRVQRAAAVLAFAVPVDRSPRERSPFRASAMLLVVAVFATGIGLWVTKHHVREHQARSAGSAEPAVIATHP